MTRRARGSLINDSGKQTKTRSRLLQVSTREFLVESFLVVDEPIITLLVAHSLGRTLWEKMWLDQEFVRICNSMKKGKRQGRWEEPTSNDPQYLQAWCLYAAARGLMRETSGKRHSRLFLMLWRCRRENAEVGRRLTTFRVELDFSPSSAFLFSICPWLHVTLLL